MKKIANIRLFTLAAVSLIASVAIGQQIASNTKSRVTVTAAEDGEPVVYNEISTRVLRSFYKTYGDIEGAKWYKLEKGYAVSFKKDGMSTSIFYTRTGAFDSRVNYYTEEKLPVAVRTLVKTNFPDYSISTITEVHKDNVVAHVVKIEDKKTVKTVKVIDGEWELIEDLTKR
jgi:hypothetical protein